MTHLLVFLGPGFMLQKGYCNSNQPKRIQRGQRGQRERENEPQQYPLNSAPTIYPIWKRLNPHS